MQGPEFIVAIVAIVFGSIIVMTLISSFTKLIKAWINRSGSSVLNEEEFLAALKEFKNKTDGRLSNLEAIIAGDKPHKQLKSSEKVINIKSDDEENDEEKTASSGKLKNMLK